MSEMVPVKGRRNAEIFKRDHLGKKILRFEEITAGDLPR
jgi:hypothetical protein